MSFLLIAFWCYGAPQKLPRENIPPLNGSRFQKSEFQRQTFYFHLFTRWALLHTGFLSHNPKLYLHIYPSIFLIFGFDFWFLTFTQLYWHIHPYFPLTPSSRRYFTLLLFKINSNVWYSPEVPCPKYMLFMNIILWFRVFKLHEKTNVTCTEPHIKFCEWS